VLAAQTADQPAAGVKSRSTGGGYSGTTVIMSAVLSAVIVCLLAAVVALAVRQVRRREHSKKLRRSVNISQVSAPGFETVRSRCSAGQEASSPAEGTAQPSQ